MLKKTITIGLASGLEARPVAMLVQIASQYDSMIYVENQNARVNAKSIMGMMTLGMGAGEALTVSADGSDEDVAINDIEKYLQGEK
ncbi:MAG: HPr family phosphocarrier protein [Lachnospiraceae bacterium]|nr:HPr family phosphocarrier protein [Lachnospiraceae bacterium]